MKMFKLDDIIGAIDKTPIACSPPADVVEKYSVVSEKFDAALDDLRDEENYRDDISSYNSVDDKFDMCVYPPRNLCKETKLDTEIVKLDMSAVEKRVLDAVFGADKQRLLDYLTLAESSLNKLRSMFHAIAKQYRPTLSYHVTGYFQRVYMLFLDKVIDWLRSSCDLQVGWELPLGMEIHNNEDPDLISEVSDVPGSSYDDVSSDSVDESPKAKRGGHCERSDNAVETTCDKKTRPRTLIGHADIVVRDKSVLPEDTLNNVRCLFQLKRPFGLLYRREFPWQVDQLQCELLGLRDSSNSECVGSCLTDLFVLVCGWQRLSKSDAPLSQCITEPLTSSREYLLMLALFLSNKVDFSCLRDCVLTSDSVDVSMNAETNPASILGKRSADHLTGNANRKRRGDEMDRTVRKYARVKKEYGRTFHIKSTTAQWYHEIHFKPEYRRYRSLTSDNLRWHNRLCAKSGNAAPCVALDNIAALMK
jgi:hypothetical protein